MFLNNLKIAWRNLLKNQAYTLINIAGLALGMACAMLIFALVRYHYRVDKHHTHYDRTFRVVSKFLSPQGEFHTPGVPYPLGKALRNDHPDIEQLAMIEQEEDPIVAVAVANGPDKKFKETEGLAAFVEPSYFRIFDYDWIAGGPTDLSQPGTVVISAKNARKYFGTTDNVVGKTIRFGGRLNARIVGIFADYKDNTDFPYSIMPSWASLKEYKGGMDEDFGNTNSSTQCFVLLNDAFTQADWDRQMMAFIRKYKPDGVKDTRFPMQPLRDIHFSTDHGGVSKGLILSLFLIGIFLIITASINFVNLATAQALRRSREVGVRKVMGSTQGQLFWQFMGETALITLTATGIAIGLFQTGQTLVQEYLNGAFKFTFYFDASVIGYLLALVVSVIVLSGVYPALVLAGFRPVTALTGKINLQQIGGFSVRRGLVITQFAISQMLLIGMIVVATQLKFVQNKDLGFRQDAILMVELPSVPNQDISKLNTFRNLASGMAEVEKFSYSMSGAPQSGWVSSNSLTYNNRPKQEDFSIQRKYIDANYLDLYGIKLAAGRNLYPSDTSRETLVNESFVRKIGAKNPAEVLGKPLGVDGKTLEIVGVVKDFNQEALRRTIAPLFLTTRSARYYAANLQLQTANFQRAISQLEKFYNQVYPDSYFTHHFVDAQIERSYQQEQTMSKLVNFFAGIAVFIGCLGLYGLVLFMAAQKTKEIGVRKVLGASLGSILWLFGKEFAKLILVAFVVAAPVAWWVMGRWLQNFQYKIELGPGIFAIAMLTTLFVAACTVSFQSLKAALMNPVKSLRSE
ncbi:ABC transporter permease [Larkinella knui]|uniref:FtsX-like permease family protein n=1 Tax=Larkinella knui TaxID=2025310 RepID=A0A3P1CE63_9BACT|nr:ABC transporter permease [Larkinella knui]RRB11515.1 FtsX-like permease family protein [Larkinella knui]